MIYLAKRRCGALRDHLRYPRWWVVIATPLLTRSGTADAHIQVDGMECCWSILQIVVIPIALGLVIHHLFPRVGSRWSLICLRVLSMVCILAIISAVVAGSASHIL